jgi:hypothetical protein
MTETSPSPTAERTAAHVAPELDRLRLAIADGARDRLIAARILPRMGISPLGMQLFPMLRNTVPDRAVEREALRACERYIPQATYDVALAELLASSIVETEGSMLRLSPLGCGFAHELNGILLEVVNDRWGRDTDLTHLERLAQRAVEAASATGGPAFSVLAPPHDPPGSTSGSRLAERLTSLRFHRADAHAAAWQSAGLTVEQVQTLGPGAQRDAVERETDRRAAAPYQALTPDERSYLVEGLRALPA